MLKDRFHAAIKNPEDPLRLAIVSTAAEDQPRSRYVVLRHMDDNLDLYFFTDFRSSKILQLTVNSRVGVLLFDPVEKIQIIIEGQARVHHQDDLTKRFWSDIPPALRKPYASRVPPGTELSQPEKAHNWPRSINDENFAVVRVTPKNLEVLQINGLAHYRARFTIHPCWEASWIAP